jgi:hypothetical protein
MRSKQTEICIWVLPYGYSCGHNQFPDPSTGLWGLVDKIGAALKRGASSRFYDFQCAKIMNSSWNEIGAGTPKRKSLLFKSKVFHAKTQR